jgi:hypothetical protein
LNLAADRHEKAPRFYDWLAQQARMEQGRRGTYVGPMIPTEAAPLNVSDLATWCGADLGGALKQVICLEAGIARLELGLFLDRLKMAVVGLACHRLAKDTEVPDGLEAEFDSDPWQLGRDFPNV